MASSSVPRLQRARFWRIAPTVLFVCGAGIAVSPLVQNGFASWNQRQLRAQWDASALATPQKGGVQRQTSATQARLAARGATSPQKVLPVARVSWPPTRIVIPSLGLDEVVVDGTDGVSLRRGPGHQPGTALPGDEGNCVIAGHRNVYGSPFARINEMAQGDIIELRLPHRTVRYQMMSLINSNDSDVSVMNPQPAGLPPRLTLITCTVPHSWQRIVLIADKVPDDAPAF